MRRWFFTTRSAALLFIAAALLIYPVRPGSQTHRFGILGDSAPAWRVKTWFNLQEGVETIDISDFKGKVIYLFGFQSWCPGCHSHGFPTLKTVHEKFADNEDVVFVAIQTVFEGFDVNTADKAKATLDQFDLDIPVGHDAAPLDGTPNVMKRYRTGGTPWTVIIDRTGIVRFNAFSIQPERAISMVDGLLAEKPRTE